MSDLQPPPDGPHPAPSIWARVVVALRWPTVVLAVAALCYLAWAKACSTVDHQGAAAVDTVKRMGRTAGDIAERFRTGRITTTFTAALPHLAPGDAPKLELTAVEATETFRRTEEHRLFWDLLPLGTTVSEIRVPVTYRYHVRLDEPWRLVVRDGTCVVHAPPIRPTRPPAIHTDRMEKESDGTWLQLGAREQMETLERSLTPTLNRLAGQPQRIDLVREQCRRRVAEFVRGWLLREAQWGPRRFTAVTVLFPSEEAPAAAGPTIRYHEEAAP